MRLNKPFPCLNQCCKALTEALRDKLSQSKRQQAGWRLADELDEIAQHCSSLPVLDSRDADEIPGYDEHADLRLK